MYSEDRLSKKGINLIIFKINEGPIGVFYIPFRKRFKHNGKTYIITIAVRSTIVNHNNALVLCFWFNKNYFIDKKNL